MTMLRLLSFPVEIINVIIFTNDWELLINDIRHTWNVPTEWLEELLGYSKCDEKEKIETCDTPYLAELEYYTY